MFDQSPVPMKFWMHKFKRKPFSTHLPNLAHILSTSYVWEKETCGQRHVLSTCNAIRHRCHASDMLSLVCVPNLLISCYGFCLVARTRVHTLIVIMIILLYLTACFIWSNLERLLTGQSISVLFSFRHADLLKKLTISRSKQRDYPLVLMLLVVDTAIGHQRWTILLLSLFIFWIGQRYVLSLPYLWCPYFSERNWFTERRNLLQTLQKFVTGYLNI